jgi:hypothetical protein
MVALLGGTGKIMLLDALSWLGNTTEWCDGIDKRHAKDDLGSMTTRCWQSLHHAIYHDLKEHC